MYLRSFIHSWFAATLVCHSIKELKRYTLPNLSGNHIGKNLEKLCYEKSLVALKF